MGAFDKYWEEKKAYDQNNKPEMVKIIPTNSPAFNRSILLGSIYDIPNMNDYELRKFVNNSFKLILNNIFFGSPDSAQYIRCFTDVRFLDAFIDVMENMFRAGTILEKDDVIKINAICYDYIRLDNSKDQNVVNRMLKMAGMINARNLPRLLGLGLSNNLANMLLIARFSSLNLNVCVKRVNFIIINQPKELMSQKMIEQIFRTIYDVMTDWFHIFPYIMLDVLPDYDENDPSTFWITDDIQEVDSTISLASLDIMETLPTESIRQTLVNYTQAYNILHNNDLYRFSMRKLSDDYQRINDVVARLNYNENIIVP